MSSIEPPDGMVFATTAYRNRRHYARRAGMREYGPGLHGPSLCSTEANPTDVYDQAGIDEGQRRWGGKKEVVVAELPPCTKCMRAQQRAEAVFGKGSDA